MKINKALVEHYIIALAVAGIAIWQTGQHNFKHLVWAALVAVFGPVASATYNHLKTASVK
jgi:hypothetical protein